MSAPYANTLGLKFPKIFNAGTRTVREAARTQPQVGTVLTDWFQPVTMVRIVQGQQDSQVTERQEPFVQQAVIQPYRGKILKIMKEGERAWQWSTIHSTPELVLDVDDIVVADGEPYRVMVANDFSAYGYVSYHVIRDYDYQSTLGT